MYLIHIYTHTQPSACIRVLVWENVFLFEYIVSFYKVVSGIFNQEKKSTAQY